jgi:signal transduction histidine kinase
MLPPVRPVPLFFSEGNAMKGRFLSISISDNGPGMDKRTLSRAFDPFFTTKEFGRGLGLSSVLGIVHSHKGYVHMVSNSPDGTTTTIYLPLREREESGSAKLKLISC